MAKKIPGFLFLAFAVVTAFCGYKFMSGIYNGYFTLISQYYGCYDFGCAGHFLPAVINRYILTASVITGAAVLSFIFTGIIFLKKKRGTRLLAEMIILSALLIFAGMVHFKKFGPTCLMAAIFTGKPDAQIIKLAKKSGNINKFRFGYSAPKYAIMAGAKPEIIKAIIEKGANLIEPVEDMPFFMTYIQITASRENASDETKKKDAEVVRLFIDKGIDVNAQSSKRTGTTPLISLAIGKNTNLEILQMLIDAGADVNAKDEYQISPLTVVINEGASSEAFQLLLNAGADFEARDAADFTALMNAAMYENTEIIKILINKSANVNARSNSKFLGGGWTALMGASPEAAALLMDNGADAKAVTNDGRTVLMLQSTDDKKIQTVKKLLEKKAALNASSHDEETAIFYAARSGALEIVKLLIANGANVNAKTRLGETPLIAASRGGSVTMLKVLSGADVKAKDNTGSTALMYAVKDNGDIEVVRFLIAKGADVNAKDNEGDTALIKISENKEVFNSGTKEEIIRNGPHIDYEILKLLFASGADVNAKNKKGETALMRAVGFNDDINVIKLLIENRADIAIKDNDGKTASDRLEKNDNMLDKNKEEAKKLLGGN